jgi:hypothetical protein
MEVIPIDNRSFDDGMNIFSKFIIEFTYKKIMDDPYFPGLS